MSRLAAWTVQRRVDVDLDRFDWVRRSAELRLPMLVFAPDGDTYVPNGPALAVLRRAPIWSSWSTIRAPTTCAPGTSIPRPTRPG